MPYGIGNSSIKIFPNLYVMLVGPSCIGKSFAMSRIQTILQTVDHSETLNLYSGHVTASGMFDAMRTAERRKNPETGKLEVVSMPQNSQFYLLNDELANDVGGVEYADLFIRALTKLYHLEPFDDRTRTSGHVHLENYSLNWIAGTTVEWLILAITRHTLLSGFFGRTVTVYQDHGSERIYPFRRKRPANWDTLYDYITTRVAELLATSGPVRLSEDARRIDESWYMTREMPTANDPTMQSSKRQHDLSLKLATLFTLARGGDTVAAETLAEAQDLTSQVVRWQRTILPSIQKGVHGSPTEKALEYLRQRSGDGQWVAHAALYKFAYDKYGIRSPEMEITLRTWLEAGIVEQNSLPRSKGGTQYRATKGA